jgi:hypothetical protein
VVPGAEGDASSCLSTTGPTPPVSDEVIEEEIKGVIWDPDFLDYGYRRVWAVLSVRPEHCRGTEEDTEAHATE